MKPKQFDAIIIGGGVIGCSIAYHLSKSQKRVLLLERHKIGSEASSAAAGMLGVQAELDTPDALFSLAKKSRDLFSSIEKDIRELTHLDIELIWNGQFKLAQTDEQVKAFKEIAKWQDSIGEQAVWLEPEEVIDLEPCLSDTVKGALYFPNEGHVSAPKLTQGFAHAAVALGTKIREYCDVQELLFEEGAVKGVRTQTGNYYGDSVVIATGAWSREWLPQPLKTDKLYYPVKGEAFSVKTESPILKRTLFTKGCYIVPKKGGELVIGATMKPYTFDKSVSVEGLSTLMNKAMQLLPVLGNTTIERFWSGIRPMTSDGFPYLGKHPDYDQLFLAVGHSRNGILLSPITGQVMTDVILGRSPVVDIQEFGLTRHVQEVLS